MNVDAPPALRLQMQHSAFEVDADDLALHDAAVAGLGFVILIALVKTDGYSGMLQDRRCVDPRQMQRSSLRL